MHRDSDEHEYRRGYQDGYSGRASAEPGRTGPIQEGYPLGYWDGLCARLQDTPAPLPTEEEVREDQQRRAEVCVRQAQEALQRSLYQAMQVEGVREDLALAFAHQLGSFLGPHLAEFTHDVAAALAQADDDRAAGFDDWP